MAKYRDYSNQALSEMTAKMEIMTTEYRLYVGRRDFEIANSVGIHFESCPENNRQ